MHEFALAVPPVVAGMTLGTAWLRWRYARLLEPTRIGAKAPELDGLIDPYRRSYSLASFSQARIVAMVFMSNQCPGVKAYDERLVRLQDEYRGAGVVLVGINPVDASLHPSESLPEMALASRQRGLNYRYLKDPMQEIAHRYGALCTPHVFLVDESRRLRYRGRIDDAFVATRVRRTYLRNAIEDVLHKRPVRVSDTAPLGCTIEWSYSKDRRVPRLLGPARENTWPRFGKGTV